MAEIIFDELPHDGGTYEKLKDGRFKLLDAATQQTAAAEKPAAAASPSAPSPAPLGAK